MAELADRDRVAEDDVKPLLSPKASCHDVRRDGGALELLSEAPAAELGFPPGVWQRSVDLHRDRHQDQAHPSKE